MIHESTRVSEILRLGPALADALLRSGISRPEDWGDRSLADLAAAQHIGIDRLLHALNCAVGRHDWGAAQAALRGLTPETTVEDAVYRFGGNDVLHEFGIRPCETLHLTLRQAAAKAGADLRRLLERIRGATAR